MLSELILLYINSLCRICPYYTARELSKTAEFILMPYNYVLSPKVCLSVCVCACVCVRVRACVCVCPVHCI